MLNKCTSFKEDRLPRSTTQVMLTWPFAQARNSTSMVIVLTVSFLVKHVDSNIQFSKDVRLTESHAPITGLVYKL